MKNIIIANAKESKSGKSINFNYNSSMHSIKKNKLEEYIGSSNPKDINGTTINIIDHAVKSGWIMIYDFEVVGKVKSRKISKESKEIDVSLISTNGITKIDKESRIKSFEDIYSPFEMLGSEFANADDSGFKIEFIDNVNDINNKNSAYVCVLQNILSRGKDINFFNENTSSLIGLLILESFKRNYKAKDISIFIPMSFKNSIKDTIRELDELNDIFENITKESPSRDLKDFIKNITFKNQKGNVIRLVNKNDIFLELNIIDRKPKLHTPTFIDKGFLKYKKFDKNIDYLNKLLKVCFYNKTTKISKLKKEQAQALNKLMNEGENILAVLKTGFGKSLIYQFASLLQPKIFLNVFPINSLIKDQSISLKSEFKLDYIVDNEELKAMKKDSYYNKLLSNRRMFLITPERLQNREMQEYFYSLRKVIGYMIFDEAHCISEWGHDFRPSYLMARYLMEKLTKDSKLKIIALTATAAPHIQKDVARLLDVEYKNIINIADSTGMERKEITFDIIEKDVDDFDQWNRSEIFTEIVDEHIEESRNNFKQGIAFFMRSGGPKDLEKDKYLIKANAYSTFTRIENKKGLGLYTGNNKHIEYEDTQISNTNFEKFINLKYIIATKSFGMGISLKKCDYVLLTEPPYSLEDLYQQSGRVGRMGQKSLVEILYHERSLIDPLSSESPYKFFLKIDKKRQEDQVNIMYRLIKTIIDTDGAFALNTKQFFETYNDDTQNNLLWSIAHLMTEFNIIEKYYVEYGSFFRMSNISIYPEKNIDKKYILNAINKKNEALELETFNNDLFSAIETFYSYYFEKLQNDKIIGINILRDKIGSTDTSGKNDNDLIYTALNEYYKTRTDEVDSLAREIIEDLISEKDIDDILSKIERNARKVEHFELMEAVSRYSISNEFIYIASLLINRTLGIKILITNIEKILTNKYNNKYLESIKNRYIIELFEQDGLHEEEEINAINTLIKDKKMKEIKELIDKKKILRGLNEWY